MNWICVNDRMPEEFQEVLVCLGKFKDHRKSPVYVIAQWESGKWLNDVNDDIEYNADSRYVTHWCEITPVAN